jgi:perosamine synthetase
VFGIVIDHESGTTATKVVSDLAAKEIGTRPFFWPMHEQPVFQKMGLFASQRYPVAEQLARQGIYLPSGLGLSDDQIDQVCRALTASLPDTAS